MLNPNNNRLDYGQVLAPPVGYSLDFAVGTTYSLDLDALVGISIALGLSGDTDSDLLKNPICMLEALRTIGDKVALFCEGGQIYIPNKPTALYILLEKIVFQVSTQKKKGIAGYPSFHPKFWLIRYVNDVREVVYRVVVLSRNLTFDRSWDVTFAMDGKLTKDQTNKNAPVGDFLNYLSKSLSTDENSKKKQKKIKSIIKELNNVEFELDSKEFFDFEFLPVGIKGHTIQNDGFNPLFKDKFDELLVMSPFLSKNTIGEFNYRNSNADCMLFTRAMSLDKLTPAYCSNFRIFRIKDAVVDGESAISEDNASYQKQDIHAKMYMVKKYSDSYLYLGSLNASHNASYGNVEFMIRLSSKNRYLNMTKLSESLFNGSEDNVDNPFQEATLSDSITVDENEEIKNKLDSVIKEINRSKPTAVAKFNEGFYDVIVSFSSMIETEYKVTISPLLSNKIATMDNSVLFKSLQITQLSNFYRIAVSDGERTVERVIIINTDGIPEDREREVVSSVVEDKNCFYRYIAFLLGDDYLVSALENVDGKESNGAGYHARSNQIPALYEKMLQTAATNKDRFKEIDYLIKVISKDGIVPEDFEALYNSFKKVVKV